MAYSGDRKREYQRAWLKARKDTYLADKFCATCGSTDQLEIDHVSRSSKSPSLRGSGTVAIFSWSQARRDEELAKCQVLCKECHVRKTNAEAPQPQHGGRIQYERNRCRCDPCLAWKANEAARLRDYRKRMKVSMAERYTR